jgi:hypothetical protein
VKRMTQTERMLHRIVKGSGVDQEGVLCGVLSDEELEQMTEEEQGEYWYCWEEQDWIENKLFHENDLEYLEELSQRDRRLIKEKHR